jgi:uncharacterized protein YjbI with pentapeptide repeats
MGDTREQDAADLLGLVNEAARAVNTRFVTFLTVGVYIAITIASTTDEMLVKGSLVTLPLLNTQIPISGWFGFYTVAPWLIVGLHVDLLLQLSMLGNKLSTFNAAVAELDDAPRRRFRDRMPSFYYVQFLAGQTASRLLYVLSGLLLYATMIVFPLVLLCWIQVRFLALHDPRITWIHRLAVIADVLVILAFLSRPLSSVDAQRLESDSLVRTPPRARLSVRTLVVGVCVAVLAFCVFARIPSDRPANGVWFDLRNLNLRDRVLTTDGLSSASINALRDGDVGRREQELDKVSRLHFLQGRDLRYGNFVNAVLPRLDLRSQRLADPQHALIETQLQGAHLEWAQMQEVLLDDADLRDASLVGAQLEGGSLPRAQMQRANLELAQLQGANLQRAELQRASLRSAQLQGADLSEAVLHEARLPGAQLQGAILRAANLQGADLSDANLQGADLSAAHLEGASLRGAQLRGALLNDAVIVGADFENADLDLTDLLSAKGETAAPACRVDPPAACPADAIPVRTLTAMRGSAGGTLELARFGRCCDRQAALIRQCGASEDAEHYRRTLNDALLDVACADAYAARGLSAQALSSPDAQRKSLAGALLERRRSDPACRGLQLLPAQTADALQHQAQQAGPADGGTSAGAANG